MPANSHRVVKPTSPRRELFTWLGAFAFSVLAVLPGQGQNATRADERTPAAVIDILEIQPFQLNVEYPHTWLESRPLVSNGLLVVLQVDPDLVEPRDAAEPVLYAGDRTIQRLNRGHGSGYVIGIIPGDIDLASEPIWFGRPELPERVTAEVIEVERTIAEEAGITPFDAEQIAAVQGDPIEVEDLADLLRGPAADLVLKYAPDERDLVDTWRLPTTGSADLR